MAIISCSKCGNAFDDANDSCPFCGTKPNEPTDPERFEPGAAGGGFGWIVFMRVILWFVFGMILFSSLIGGIVLMAGKTWPFGILAIFGGVLLAFIAIAGGMIALNNASNLHKIATNTARILDEMQKQ